MATKTLQGLPLAECRREWKRRVRDLERFRDDRRKFFERYRGAVDVTGLWDRREAELAALVVEADRAVRGVA